MTSTPAEVAALLKVAAMEPATLDDLDGCLRRLRDVQKARRELAKVPPGDPGNPPEILHGIDPTRWPRLVVEGRQAVTDLVGSVIPMVYAQTRRTPNAADVRGQMFVELMGAAYRFDPQRTSPEGWASYAWMTIKHARMRGVDEAGVVRKRTSAPRPATVTLEGRDPASRAPDPGEVVEEQQAAAAMREAVAGLPSSLREPLLESMQGSPLRVVAEHHGYSESTAHRRIAEARDQLRAGLAARAEEGAWVPFLKGTDAVLERSQRLFEDTPVPTPPTLDRTR